MTWTRESECPGRTSRTLSYVALLPASSRLSMSAQCSRRVNYGSTRSLRAPSWKVPPQAEPDAYRGTDAEAIAYVQNTIEIEGISPSWWQ